jgi:two-component SAPR family response regulator
VVDDEDPILELIRLFIETARSDITVKTFDNSTEAQDWIINNHCDLVITDIKMPFINGVELCQTVKNTKSELPVVYITGMPLSEKETDVFDDGLQKPIKKKDVQPILENFLNDS